MADWTVGYCPRGHDRTIEARITTVGKLICRGCERLTAGIRKTRHAATGVRAGVDTIILACAHTVYYTAGQYQKRQEPLFCRRCDAWVPQKVGAK